MLTYGVAVLARPTFDVPFAEQMKDRAFAALEAAGIRAVGPRALLFDRAAAEGAVAQIEASGRLGFHLCDGPDRWPLHFMDNNFVPPEMSGAMREAVRTCRFTGISSSGASTRLEPRTDFSSALGGSEISGKPTARHDSP